MIQHLLDHLTEKEHLYSAYIHTFNYEDTIYGAIEHKNENNLNNNITGILPLNREYHRNNNS